MKSLSLRAGLVLFAALVLGLFAAVSYDNAALGAVVSAGVAAAGLPFASGRPLHLLGLGTATVDGSLVYGSQLVTINTVQFVAESINITRGTRELDSMNHVGVPNKQALIPTKARGSLTLQLPDGTTAAPSVGATIPIVPVGGGAALNYLISEVGDQFTSEGVTKVTVSVVEKLN